MRGDNHRQNHAHVTGSLTVPPFLASARRALNAGELIPADYKQIEDRAVDEAIALQEALGLGLINDGELRRAMWFAALTSSIEGLGPAEGYSLKWYGTDGTIVEYPMPYAIVDKVRRVRSNTVEEFTYLRSRARAEVKVTIPSPTFASVLWSPRHSTSAYSDVFGAVLDMASVIRAEIEDLANLGCRHIQIDAPDLSFMSDAARGAALAEDGIPVERLAAEAIELINDLADVPGVEFSIHICRGNLPDAWMANGGYEKIAEQVFGRAPNIDRFLLEYTSPGVGSFEPLAKVPDDKQIVLGLVASKSREIESPDLLERRIREAAQYFPLEQLALSSSCGFANDVCTKADQQAKLAVVASVANTVWG
jgi:5-methyltetrahydropteroyltriglutamate--homocysteine methyltransferase